MPKTTNWRVLPEYEASRAWIMGPREFSRRFQGRCFYHFTDTRNVESIREHGGLLRLGELRRRGLVIPAPGGNDWSHAADARKGLDEYVHLCFMNQHPMEFVARNEGRLANVRYLEILPEVLDFEGNMVTMDVSNKTGVSKIPWREACQRLDFEVMYERTDWRDPDIQTRLKAAKKCELLVPCDVPLKFIRHI